MPIHTTGRRLGLTIPLKTVRDKVAGKGHRGVYANIQLTSMVDMFTIMVVFLLQTFSASGELLYIQKDITVPDVNNWRELGVAPLIAIGAEAVTLDGFEVARPADLAAAPDTEWDMPTLEEKLNEAKAMFKVVHPGETFNGEIIVQSDKAVDFKILRRVLFACAKAEYTTVHFAVRGKAGSGPAGTTAPAPAK
ncbi:MAG TPA: biopolymer transporter ExbD [Myxococcota bacterium]|jgi:biopolymer transport protein ExbD|nr:biopolymer transporter ExbD [Myxococcota bacterium]